MARDEIEFDRIDTPGLEHCPYGFYYLFVLDTWYEDTNSKLNATIQNTFCCPDIEEELNPPFWSQVKTCYWLNTLGPHLEQVETDKVDTGPYSNALRVKMLFPRSVHLSPDVLQV